MTLFADIIRQDPEEFSIEGFKRAVGAVSQHCPVYILSNPDDEITGSDEALKKLSDAASGGGMILTENYKHVEIKSSHLTMVDRDQYPFAPREEAKKTRDALQAIFDRLGIDITAKNQDSKVGRSKRKSKTKPRKAADHNEQKSNPS